MSRVSGCILIVGNSAEDREYYRRCLAKDSDYAYTFVEAESGTSAIHLWQQHQPIGVLLDYQLPDLNGLEVLDQLVALGLDECSVIMLAEQAEIEIAVLSIKAGAQDYLAKEQITADILRIAVARAIKNTQVRRDLQSLSLIHI